jgi:hypothetical protein
VNIVKYLLYSFISLFLLTGQFSDRNTAAFSLSLSCSSSLHSNNMWFNGCSPLLQEHIGLPNILNVYRYDLMLPCPVTTVVKFGVTLIFAFNLSDIMEKNYFVIAPFLVWSHSLCHLITLRSFSSLVLFGILL